MHGWAYRHGTTPPFLSPSWSNVMSGLAPHLLLRGQRCSVKRARYLDHKCFWWASSMHNGDTFSHRKINAAPHCKCKLGCLQGSAFVLKVSYGMSTYADIVIPCPWVQRAPMTRRSWTILLGMQMHGYRLFWLNWCEWGSCQKMEVYIGQQGAEAWGCDYEKQARWSCRITCFVGLVVDAGEQDS